MSFARDHLAKVEERLEKLAASIEKERSSLDRLQRNREQLMTLNKSAADEIAQVREQFDAHKKVDEEKASRIRNLKRDLQTCLSDMDHHIKETAGKESLIEKLFTEKYEVFRRCKLEEINLPLSSGSLDDVTLDDIDVRMRKVKSLYG